MKDTILKAWCALQADRRGVTAVEYAVVAGLIVAGLAAVFGAFFGDLTTAFNTIGGKIPT